jgi:transketolase
VRDPQQAARILDEEERPYVVTLHNGWPGFLYPFLLPLRRREQAFGMDRFCSSGRPQEMYRRTGFDAGGLRRKAWQGLRAVRE